MILLKRVQKNPMHLNEIKKELESFHNMLMKEDIRKEELEKQLIEKTMGCKELEKTGEVLSKTLQLLEQCNIFSRDFVKIEVEQLVTQGLRGIFDDSTIQFNINFVTKRNQVEAEFTISHTGENVQRDIMYTRGGGLVDIISIALRIIIMQLLKVKGPLILDEPGKFISSQYIGAFGKFLTEVSKTFNRQIIMITHNEHLAAFADNMIEVSQTNGVSEIRKVE